MGHTQRLVSSRSTPLHICVRHHPRAAFTAPACQLTTAPSGKRQFAPSLIARRLFVLPLLQQTTCPAGEGDGVPARRLATVKLRCVVMTPLALASNTCVSTPLFSAPIRIEPPWSARIAPFWFESVRVYCTMTPAPPSEP